MNNLEKLLHQDFAVHLFYGAFRAHLKVLGITDRIRAAEAASMYSDEYFKYLKEKYPPSLHQELDELHRTILEELEC